MAISPLSTTQPFKKENLRIFLAIDIPFGTISGKHDTVLILYHGSHCLPVGSTLTQSSLKI